MNTVTISQGGKITGLQGQISIVVNGSTRALQEGEIVPAGAQLVIANNASAQIVTDSGTTMALNDAGTSPLAEAPDTVPSTEGGSTGANTLDAEIQQLQDLIAAGEDPTANLPETAAGGNLANQGDSGYVALDRDGSEVIASSGYDTGTFSVSATTTDTTLPTYDVAATAVDDVNTIDEDTVATGNVLDNDTAAGITLSVTTFEVEGGNYDAGSTATLENGTLTINADGSYTFTPNENWNGTVPTITYTTNAGDSATLTIVVNAVPDDSVISTDTGSVQEDVVITTGGTLTATDIDNPDLTFLPNTVTDDYGTFTVDANGEWSYTLNNDADAVQALGSGETVPQTFTVTLSDGSNTTVDITINGTDDLPVISDDSGAVIEDTVLSAGGTLTATDVDNPDLTFVPNTVTDTYGTFTVDTNGVWSYVLDNDAEIVQALTAGEVVPQTFTVTLSDGSTTTVDITITGTNDVPVIDLEASDDSGSVQEDLVLTASGTITANDADTGAVLTFSGDDTGTYGSFAIDPTTGEWTYTLDNANQQALAQGESHTDTFTVTVTDEFGGVATQEVVITVTGTNDAPVISAAVDTGDVQEDGALTATGTITAGDVDNGAVLTFSGDDTGTYGGFSVNPTTGAWIYTLNNDAVQFLAEGETRTETFTVTVTDEFGATDTQDVTVTITGTNDLPIISEDSGAVIEDTVLSAGGTLTATDADNPDLVFVANSVTDQYGTFTVGTNGVWTYVLNNDADIVQALNDGEVIPQTFTVSLSDGSTTTVDVTITGVDDGVTLTGLDAESSELTVAEANLETGSSPDFAALTNSGSFSFESVDGLQTLSVGGTPLTLTQLQGLSASTPVTITTLYGTLTLTGFTGDAAGGTVNYSYTLNATVDNDSAAGATNSAFTDSINVVVTDEDNSSISNTLDVVITDDVATAVNDTDTIASNEASVSGNVITATGTTNSGADTLGADDATLTAITSNNISTNIATTNSDGALVIQGQYGQLTIDADGDYTYVRTAGSAGGQNDVFTYTLTDGDGDTDTATLTIAVGDSTPTVVIPDAGGSTTTVNEAGLPARDGEPAGSNASSNSETTSGTISFTSVDGLSAVSLGGHVLTTSPQTFADGLTASYSYDAATGAGTITYSYTLQDNTSGDNTSVSFAVVVTDADGDLSPAGNLVINITDDVVTAVNDTDTIASNEDSVSGNVITATGTTNSGADTLGADDATLTAITSNNISTNIATTNSDGALVIQGQYGQLTIDADGDYTYVRTAGSAGGQNDVFTYTLTDGDGDTDTATLTIAVGDSTPTVVIPDAGGSTTTVNEAGLPARDGEPAGSNASSNSETTSGTISFTSVDGLSAVSLGGHVLTTSPQTFADGLTASYSYDAATGAGTITYSYTLKDNTSGDNTSVSFAVVVTDADGDLSPAGNLVINITDDVVTAVNDTDTIANNEASVSGNVITATGTTNSGADTLGADDATLTAITSNNISTNIATTNSDGALVIQGQYGQLTIDADGDYTYVRTAGSAGGQNDVFTYTLTDGDGDTDTATLTIAVGDSTPTVVIPDAGGSTTTVNEAGLPARDGEPAGSNASSNSETTSGTISFTSVDGLSAVSLGGHVLTTSPQTFADGLTASYSYDAATGAGTITYSYTLQDNTSGDNTSVSFAVVVTDADGDLSPAGNLVINITDDVVTAVNDTDTIASNEDSVSGNVITATGTTNSGADTLGADDATLTAITSNNISTNIATTNSDGALVIQGQYGQLTIDADGDYTYVRTAGSAGGQNDVFTYTLTDGDGDTDTATLTIAVGDSTPTVVIPDAGGSTTTVNEAGLPARDGEPAGSNASSNSETTSGTISFTSVDGLSAVSLGGHVLTTSPQTFADGLTASYSYDAATGAGTITYSYTLQDNTSGDNTSVSFAVVVTDADGDLSPAGNLVINITDDVVTAVNDTDTIASNEDSVSGNVITATGTTNSGADTLGADDATLTAITSNNISTNIATTNSDGALVIQGQYGQLTIDADGDYTYVRTAGSAGGQNDVFTYTLTDGDGDTDTATLTIAVGDSTPTVVIPDAGGSTTTVNEAGLPARDGEPAGSNASSNSETTSGTISFTSVDGLSAVSLGGHVLTTSPQTFADGLTASYSYDAATGAGTITYSYTLQDNTSGDNTSVSFAVVVTDADGDLSPAGNLVINITDDVVTAVNDTDTIASNEDSVSGNVITATGTTNSGADTLGADDATLTAITSNNISTNIATTNSDGALVIQGQYGQLTIDADGDYTYVRTAGSAGGQNDVFTYTLTDGDGDTDTATLTIAVGDSTPTVVIPDAGGSTTTVNEAGLPARDGEPAGSNASSNSETTSGTISFTSVDGLSAVSLGGHVLTTSPQTFADGLTASYSYDAATGAGTITYSYTLKDNTSGDNTSVSFAVVVTDADGDLSPAGNLVINITDDVVTAVNDTDTIASNEDSVSGNVITATGTTNSGADTLGADDATLTAITSNNISTNIATTNSDGALVIQGQYGQLTIDADGDYTYVRTAGSAGGQNDVFTYTLTDGDGDTDTATLTIAVGDSTPTVVIPDAGGSTTTVNEAGLPARDGEPAGSNASSNSETTSGTISFTSVDGLSAVSLGGHVLTTSPQTFADGLTASYSYDAATGAGTITYSYTLQDNTSGDNTSVSFAVVVTDADGDLSPAGNLVINITDDVVTAVNDTDTIASNEASVSGNVITATGTTNSGADTLGADDATLTAITSNNISTNIATTNSDGALVIQGQYGQLTIDADGDYTYVRTAGSAGGQNDVFTYTLTDGDGDTDTATLTIAVGDSTPTVVIPDAGGSTTTVNEAGLPARDGEPAGSNASSNSETTSGTISFTSVDGLSAVSLGGHVLTTSPQTFADGLTASYSYDAATGAGTITYSYTLQDNTSGDNTSVSFAVVVTDADGDLSPAGNLVINITDDVVTAVNDTDTIASNEDSVSGNVITATGTTNSGADTLGADDATLTAITSNNISTNIATTNSDGALVIQGQYGQLTIDADGDYTYVRTAGSAGGQNDVFTYTLTDGDGDTDTATLTIAVGDSTPTVVIPDAGGSTTTVNEAGLPARDGEPAGSNASSNSETTSGTISFTSVDGLSAVSLGGHVLTTSPQTFADGLTASYSYDAATGAGTITYSYTLQDNTSGDNTSVSFAVVVTDADGDLSPAGNLVINITDDVVTAVNDTDTIASNEDSVSGNVITATGTTNSGADTLGADDATLTAITSNNISTNIATTNSDGALVIQGQYGQLTIDADGDYTYVRTAGSAGGQNDVFTYTLTDGDGDTDTATLTIAVGDSTPTVVIPDAGGSTTTVNEAGLPARDGEPAGSNASSNSETTSGTISFTSVDGLSAVSLGGHVLTTSPQTFADGLTASYSYDAATGAGTITYSYTLKDNTSGDNTSVSFAVVVTDADGDLSPAGNLVINITDDVVTAVNDTDTIASNEDSVSGNVITATGTTNSGADTLGADDATLTAITSNNISTNIATTNSDGALVIQGQYGQLTIDADGDYTYVRTAGSAGGQNDVFTYTLTDGDGDTDTATLTIAVGDSTPTVVIPDAGGSTTTVNEAGLPARDGEPAGSNASSNSETTSGTISFTSVDGLSAVSLGGHVLTTSPQTFADGLTASYSYDAATGAGTITYSYTLQDNTSGDNTSVSFAVVVTDADGDLSPAGNLVINITDDVVTAVNDTDTIASNEASVSGNVITATGTTNSGADTLGADDATLTAITSNNISTNIATTNSDGALVIQGQYGQLTIDADGDYTYVRTAGSAGGQNDVFTYTLTDGDGDTDTATLTIAVGDSTPTVVIPDAGGSTTTVNEAGLPARDGEPAGSNASSNSETTSGTISFTSVDGLSAVSLGGHVLTTSPQTFADGLTASYSYDAATGAGTITYSYTLQDNTSGDNTSVSFAVVVTDADGDLSPAGNLVINITDDVVTAVNDTDTIASNEDSVSGNVITATGTTNSGADTLGADDATLTAITSNNISTNIATTNSDGALVIQGQYGQLTIDADGDYTYVRTAGSAGGQNDVFTYTLTDGDGDTDTATLTIAVGDSTPTVVIPDAGGSTTTVNEAGLPARDGEPAGSNASSNSETTSGTISFTSVDGLSAVSLGGHVLTTSPQTFADGLTASYSYDAATGAGTITYSYTLQDNTSGDNTSVSFAVVVTDADGDLSPAGNLVINITDDVVTAVNDTDTIASNEDSVSGNVITATGTTNSGADTLGADDATLTAITSNNISTNIATTNSDGALVIQGQYGQLTIDADGDYTYVRTAGSAGGQNDVFTYTLTDGDGDTDTATLTIAVGDSTPTVVIPDAGGSTTTVNEAGLPARDGEPAGSNASSNSETTSGTISFTSVDGLSAVSLGGHVLTTSPQTFADGLTASYSYDAATGAGTITYSYTLQDNTSGDNTSVSFAVVVTDADGDLSPAGNLVINITDDVVTAVNDTDTIASNEDSVSGNVITATGTTNSGADTLGADDATLTAITSNNISTNIATTNSDGALVIQGQYGQLTIDADGDYTYVRTAGSAGGQNDVFTYTLTDGDGDTDTATLTIAVGDSTPTVVIPDAGGSTTTVNEAGLPARDGEPAGSNASSNSETTSGTISFTSVDGLSAVSLGGHVLTTSPQTFADGLTASYSYDAATGAGTITYSYTLKDNTSGDNTSVSFAVVVTDADGDLSPAGNLVINITDDVVFTTPEASTGTNAADSSYTNTLNIIGADGPYSSSLTDNIASWSATNSFAASELTANGKVVYYFVDESNPNILYAYTSNEDTVTEFSSKNASQILIFTLTTDPTAANADGSIGSYTLDLVHSIDKLSTIDIADLEGGKGGISGTVYVTYDSDTATYAIYNDPVKVPSDQEVSFVLSGLAGADRHYEEVNGTDNGFGVSNPWVSGDEVLVVDYTQHVASASFNFIVGNNDPTAIYYEAYDSNGVLLGYGYIESGHVISDLGAISYIELSAVDGQSFQLRGTSAQEIVSTTEAVDLAFNVDVTDSDGDANEGTIDITLAAPSTVIPTAITSYALATVSATGLEVSEDTSELDTQSLRFKAGSSTLENFTFGHTDTIHIESTSGKELNLNWTVSSDGQTLYGSMGNGNGNPVIELTLSGSAIAAGSEGNISVNVKLIGNLPGNLDVSDLVITDISVLGSDGTYTVASSMDVAVLPANTTVVSEEALPEGVVDDSSAVSAVSSGVITLMDVQTNGLTVQYIGGRIAVGNETVNWDDGWDSDNLTLTGSVDGDAVITIQLIAPTDGSDEWTYTVTLLSAIDHPEINVEDSLDLQFLISGIDNNREAINSSFSVTVEDDSPVISSDESVVVTGTDIPTVLNGSYALTNFAGSRSLIDFDGFTITAKGFTDSTTDEASLASASIYGTNDGIGVNSIGGSSSGFSNEVDFRYTSDTDTSGVSEQLIITLDEGTIAYGLDIDFTKFYVKEGTNEGEVAIIEFWRDGELVETQTVTAANSTGNDNASFSAITGGFDTVIIKAASNGNTGTGDNSDFTVSNIEFTGTEDTAIGYASGDVDFAWGADGAGTLKLLGIDESQLFTTNGVEVKVEVSQNGNTITATTAGDPSDLVFTLQFTPSTGHWDFYQYQLITGIGDHTIDFNVGITDADGDTAIADISVTPAINLNVIEGTHGDNEISGNSDEDIIIGDLDGLTVVPGQSYNIAFMVDTSASISSQSLSQMKAQLTLVFESLLSSAVQNGGVVNLLLVDFDTQSRSQVSVTLTSEDVDKNGIPDALDKLSAELLSMQSGGRTNYESVFDSAAHWFNDQNASYSNLAYFITDGSPNTYTKNNGSTAQDNTKALNQAIDAFDYFKENGITVNAIGLGSQINNSLLNSFVANGGTVQTGVDTHALAQAIMGSSETLLPGSDAINGNNGNDIIFGDAIHLSGIAGQGFSAIHDYVANALNQASVSDLDIQQYILGHTAEFDISGVNDQGDVLNGGSGSDVIFGQGGNDIIDGGANSDVLLGGEGNDLLYGGQGNDILTGGSGIDTFVWVAGDTGTDVITDFSISEGDKLDISDLLQWNGSDDLGSYLGFIVDQANSTVTIEIDADADGHVDQSIVLNGVNMSGTDNDVINSLLSSDGPLIVQTDASGESNSYATTDSFDDLSSRITHHP
ncbi:VCBS domain-containing protein [Shewanella avicenniae]|uniref:VCBS domain-containing protein n=1 Tax=Shewanella avicenniae TaxID=2814294 RepID=A0ABX7QRL7_9GAMM|nr:VCBS domain-containing protein [Shewanella avicenniae]QSX34059.1 VCBS domain-containing protein [Shewanella avicenniae]